MVPVNNLVLETVIYGSLWNSKSGKIKIKETQNLNLRYSWLSVNLKIHKARFPDFEIPGFSIPRFSVPGFWSWRSRKLKIPEAQNLGSPKSGKLLYGHNEKIRETQKLGTENPGIEDQGISKSGKLKIRETQYPGSCYMVIRWFDGGSGRNDPSPSPPPCVNYHMLTLRLRQR